MTLNSTEYPTDVAVDSARGILFTAVMGPEDTQGRLLRSGLDGSGVTELASGLNKSFGVCVDEARGHVFYVQGGTARPSLPPHCARAHPHHTHVGAGHGGGVYCMAYGDAPCDTPHAGGKVVDGLDYPFMCSADSTWSAYGGPTYLLVSSTGVPGYVSVITSTGARAACRLAPPPTALPSHIGSPPDAVRRGGGRHRCEPRGRSDGRRPHLRGPGRDVVSLNRHSRRSCRRAGLQTGPGKQFGETLASLLFVYI